MNTDQGHFRARLKRSKREKVTGNWGKLRNKGLHNLHLHSNKSSDAEKKENEIGGTCSTDGELRNAYTILVPNPKGKRPVGRPTCRRENNIKTDPKETGAADSCEHGNESSGSVKMENLLTS
jgi:hypothetical protein